MHPILVKCASIESHCKDINGNLFLMEYRDEDDLNNIILIKIIKESNNALLNCFVEEDIKKLNKFWDGAYISEYTSLFDMIYKLITVEHINPEIVAKYIMTIEYPRLVDLLEQYNNAFNNQEKVNILNENYSLNEDMVNNLNNLGFDDDYVEEINRQMEQYNNNNENNVEQFNKTFVHE